MTLGERIKACRQKAGLSQEKTAELVGVSRQAVAKWESGRSAPSTENLFRLAEVFGTTVDFLIHPEDPAEKQEKEPCRWKHGIYAALLIAAGYLVIYLIGRIVWCDLSQSSLLGWLFTVRPMGEHSYLYGWLLSSRLFWYAMAVSVLPACFGQWKFSLATFGGFFAGLLLGMVFGPNPEGAALGQGDYGWLIWGVVFFLSIPAGILWERLSGRKEKHRR